MPTIPKMGNNGIETKGELELEYEIVKYNVYL